MDCFESRLDLNDRRFRVQTGSTTTSAAGDKFSASILLCETVTVSLGRTGFSHGPARTSGDRARRSPLLLLARANTCRSYWHTSLIPTHATQVGRLLPSGRAKKSQNTPRLEFSSGAHERRQP